MTTTLDDLLRAATELAPEPLEAQSCGLASAAGRVLAAPLCADRDLPPYDRAAMDGFALRREEADARMHLAGRIDAGADMRIEVPAGSCVSIATGARVPAGLDTVVQHEWTSSATDAVEFKRMADAGANIHPRGADARAGQTLVPAGGPMDVVACALASACGCTQVEVRRRPRLAICTSGDEVVPVEAQPADHQIRNSNGPMLQALADRLGCTIERMVHLSDDADAVLAPLADLKTHVDVIVTTGGISAGRGDVLAEAFDDLGVAWTVIGALVQPGRPIRLGRLGETIVVCLPGNPVSALVMGTLVLGRVCAALNASPTPSWAPMTVAHSIRPNPRRTLIRPCRLIDAQVHVPPWQGSGDLAHAASTHGVVRLPMQAETIEAGTRLPVLRWP